MSSTLLTRGTLLVDDELKDRAAEAVQAVADEEITEVIFTTTTGRRVSFDPAIVDLFGHVLSRVAQGGELTVHTVPELLSTITAAEMLGVSRPTLMKLIRRGELEPVMAGTHHRIRTKDISALREKRELARRASIDELMQLGEDDED
ncbi:helix-turn-helix domain-containing protein [Paramicrobacterium fandaimingii]|uniref:helix-turn-helix domain-containing protein n=1 Tax=Paramicrobacterium fandaimingii TaxID=2708079 RepID=UPI0014201133|nr:helix-turn-helix domain-containing protein [Microbacterium fandaimingii]